MSSGWYRIGRYKKSPYIAILARLRAFHVAQPYP